MDRDLDGRVALVTGATSGIGRATATLLAAAGARVVVNSASSVAAGRELASELPGGLYVRADVSDPDAVEAAVAKAIDECGRLDIVVNNAGTATPNRIAHDDLAAVTPDAWDRILGVNLLGPWNVIRAAAEALAADGDGVVVNVSSLAGARPAGSSVPYAVSKAALDHLTRLLANALAPDIRVNAVAPGLTATRWSEGWDDAKQRYAAATPMGRIGTVDDVARACVALIRLRHVTGEIVTVDGGRHLR